MEDVRGKGDERGERRVGIREGKLEAEDGGGVGAFAYEDDARPKGWVAWCEADVDALGAGLFEAGAIEGVKCQM